MLLLLFLFSSLVFPVQEWHFSLTKMTILCQSQRPLKLCAFGKKKYSSMWITMKSLFSCYLKRCSRNILVDSKDSCLLLLPANSSEWSFCLVFHLTWRKITGLITSGWLHPSLCPFFLFVFLYKKQLRIPTFTRNGQDCLWVTWAG